MNAGTFLFCGLPLLLGIGVLGYAIGHYMGHQHRQRQLRETLHQISPVHINIAEAQVSEDERCAIALDQTSQKIIVYDGMTNTCHLYAIEAVRNVTYIEDGKEVPDATGPRLHGVKRVRTVELQILFDDADNPRVSVCFLASQMNLRNDHPWYQDASRKALAWKARLEAVTREPSHSRRGAGPESGKAPGP